MSLPITSVAGNGVTISANVVPAEKTGETGFDQFLQSAIDGVQKTETTAQNSVDNLLQGNGEDLHKTMIAVEKADLSFQLMMEVRNKIISAYQEVSRMNF